MQSGPGFIPTFLYYFVGTTFIVVFVVSQGFNNPELIDTLGNPFRVGIWFGLLAGGLGAYFNSHNQIELPIKNRGAFLAKLKETMTALGYVEASEIDQVKIYERSGASKFFSSKLFVELEAKTARISGRASSVRALQKHLEPS
ncbi:hypothetical protein OsccyDRAFT_4088 [Leptolyngbyaceae cyanobacterium JSC-12]|nr:hypothetical protein OsccyDRAFT_4088 [Leptolyngbyaceae cyanobacterium JSC-12]